MARVFKLTLCVSILLCVFCASAYAAAKDEGNIINRQERALGAEKIIDALPEEAKETVSDLDTGNLEGSVWKIVNSVTKIIAPVFRAGLKSVVIIICVIILEGMLCALHSGSAKIAAIAGTLAIAAVSIADAKALIGLGSKTIGDIDMFSKVLLPAVAAASASTGAVTASAAVCAASMLFSDVLLTVISRLLLPLVYAYIAASAAAAAVGGRGLDTIAKMIKWFTTLCLIAIMTVFVVYLNLTKAFTGAADAAIVKAAKLTISGAVPVVGSIIANAAETVTAGASVVRSALGLTGVLGVLAVCLVPFVKVGAQYLLYLVAAMLSDAVADEALSGLVGRISGAFGMILGMLGSCTFLVMISIVSAIRLTVP